MSVEAEAAEKVLRMEIMLTEAAVKLAVAGVANLAMLLIAAARNEVHMGGRTDVAKMLEQGKQITAFPINTDSLTKFAELAKKHKLACGYIPDPQNPATTNVIIKAEDAELANKIRKAAGIEILPGIDEKKQSADLSGSVSEKSENTMQNRSASTTTTTMTKNSPTINPTQAMNNGITQDQANMLLTRLTALSGVLANGGDVYECQAALMAVTDELKRLLTPPEQEQKAEKTEQPKSEDKSKGKSEEKTAAAPKPSGKKKVSIRQRVADIKARATHTPQHTKDKQYQPKHSINDLTK